MKRINSYIAAIVLTVLMTAGLSSCVYESFDSIEDDNITLFIRLGILDGPQSRSETSDVVECMQSIRIVLLDDDRKVEYNKKITYDSPVTESDFIVIPTVKGKKQIFFIANEESVVLEEDGKEGEGQDRENKKTIASLIEEYEGTTKFEDAINNAYFKLDPEKPLPMTSEYTLDVGRAGENNYTFYVVPVATKFTFHITNKRTDGTSHIREISIEKMAEANYVMPHVRQQYRNWKNADGTMASLYWIDWLKKVVDVTNQPENEKNPSNSDANRRLEWILDYELPEGCKHETKVMFEGDELINGALDKGNQGGTGNGGGQENQEDTGDRENQDDENVSGKAGDTEETEDTEVPEEPEEELQYETLTFGPYYAPESKFPKSSSNPDSEQTYTLVLELTDGTSTEISLSRELSFVTALFRNTHVVIDITLEMNYMHVYGEIRSWKDNKVYGMLTEED